MMRLSLRDVWAAPPGVAEPVVRGLSLDLAAGEWVALGGANGSGKTTLLLVAAGLLAPRRGMREVRGESAARPPRIATILQDPSVQLFAPTVAEEIGLTALHLGFTRERIDAEVRRRAAALGLAEDLLRDPRTLSAGRQQLVLLAAALACEPDLLVADEPGAHLDSTARARVLDALREECARGLGVLWATQEETERHAATRRVRMTPSEEGHTGLVPWTDAPVVPVAGRPPGPDRGAEDGEGGTSLRVSPDVPAEGPRVRTSCALEIAIPARGITALVGPNGSGKTVLLLAACGLLDLPQVVVRRDAGLIPPILVAQYPERQIFEETVEREVIFAAVARGMPAGEAKRRAAEVFDRLGVRALFQEHRRTWELSAGERRLVLLVAALIAPSGLLALDEPTAGLDPDRRAHLAELVGEVARERAVLIASQDESWLLRMECRTVGLAVRNGSSPSKKTD